MSKISIHSNNRQSKKFPGFGRCIYCAEITSLTDEHLVPLSLGGCHIIEGASCRKCNKITSLFEGKLAKGLWGEARRAYGATTRHKNQRTDEPFNMSGILVAREEYPAAMMYYRMPQSGLMQGFGKDVELSSFWNIESYGDRKKLDKLHAKFPGKVTTRFRHVPDDFARMLLKIGYCQVLTHVDIDAFDPICVPYILSSKMNYSYLVGEAERAFEPTTKLGYKLETEYIGENNRAILVARVQLYSNLLTPTYEVVVGQCEGINQIERLLKQLGVSYSGRIFLAGRAN